MSNIASNASNGRASMAVQTRIFLAKKIITMHPEHPFATAVAVKDGRILALGELDDVVFWLKNSPFTPYEVDTTLKDKILLPGLVDAHTHIGGLFYSGHFVSQIPWPRPEGGFFPVYPKKADVLNRLKELDQEIPPGELLFGIAYDENKTGGFLHIKELDEVSTKRPILVSNLVFHRFWVNSFLLEKAGIDPNNLPSGIETDADGKPNGTLIEGSSLAHVLPAIPELTGNLEKQIKHILPLFTAGGQTTICNAAMGGMGGGGLQGAMNTFLNVFSKPEVKLRVVGMPSAMRFPEGESFDDFIDEVRKVQDQASDKCRVGHVKLYLDGSIISRTSPIGWPGYWDGTPEKQMQNDPELLTERIIKLHEAGLSTATHANSRPGCQVVLDAVREAQCRRYRPDMRHRIEHAYGINEAQLRLAKELGVAIQFFTTQIYYYGEAHLKLQGPNRAHHITPTGTAKRLGVSWGFHNDPPGTPQLPWIAAWATVHRMTEKGTILGPEHRVTVEDALRAMTIEHAYQLHLDHEIGSIEIGKKADFCVLEADPLEIDPMELKDMPVWGTVFAGELNPVKRI